MHSNRNPSPMILRSPAKINLTLDILGKDERTGKHFVNTVLYRHDDLADTIELKAILGKKNILHCSDPALETPDNLILKALDLLHITGWEIWLEKKIPIMSGLGGGSSNAGTVLKYFGQQKGIPEHELLELGRQLGSDVPFFVLDDNLAYFEGFGDQLVQSWTIEPLKIEVVNTGIQVSTKEAYENIDVIDCGKNSAKTEALLLSLRGSAESTTEAIPEVSALPHGVAKPVQHPAVALSVVEGKVEGSARSAPRNDIFHNDFESQFFKKHPSLSRNGHLSGSGGYLWNLS